MKSLGLSFSAIYYIVYDTFADFFYNIKYKYNRKKKRSRNLQLFKKYCRNLPRNLPESIFVKVGANDGLTLDPCSDILLANTKWKGLLIEPQSYFIDKLKETFNDVDRFTIEQVAISSMEGKEKFYYLDHKVNESIQDLKPWVFMVASFNKNHLLKLLDESLQPFIRDCTVETNTLTNILKRNNLDNFNLLHIDTEGHDLVVLKSLDLSVCSPTLIYIEYNHLSDSDNTELLNLLNNYEYTVYDCGIDYFAVNKKKYMRLL